jgi:hypothetical protein
MRQNRLICALRGAHARGRRPTNNRRVGYSLNRSCPAQRVGLGRSDLAELNQRPGPMTFSYRSCSTYVNSPDRRYASATGCRHSPILTLRNGHCPALRLAPCSPTCRCRAEDYGRGHVQMGDATCSPRVPHTHLAAGTASLQAFKGALDDRLCLCPGAGGLTQQVEELQE